MASGAVSIVVMTGIHALSSFHSQPKTFVEDKAGLGFLLLFILVIDSRQIVSIKYKAHLITVVILFKIRYAKWSGTSKQPLKDFGLSRSCTVAIASMIETLILSA